MEIKLLENSNQTITHAEAYAIVNALIKQNESDLAKSAKAYLRAWEDDIEKLKVQNGSCITCLFCDDSYQLMSSPPQYNLTCNIFKTVFVNDSTQFCSKYKRKANGI